MSLASIIIPVYNGEEYIERAIECAPSQTYPYKEVIVVDDASTDSTPQKVKNYPVVYHRNKQNMERVYSRNKGVELSKGEFIFFLDYDDLWREDYIASSVEVLKELSYSLQFSKKLYQQRGKGL